MVNSNIVACAFEFVYPLLLAVMQRNKQSLSSTITAGLSRNTDILIRNGDFDPSRNSKRLLLYVSIVVMLSVLSLSPVRLWVDRLARSSLWLAVPLYPKAMARLPAQPYPRMYTLSRRRFHRVSLSRTRQPRMPLLTRSCIRYSVHP